MNGMVKKPKTKEPIVTKTIPFPELDSKQADQWVKIVKRQAGKEFSDLVEAFDFNLNFLVRLISLSNLAIKARQEKGLSIKEIAKQLKRPQYRIRCIEDRQYQTIRAIDLEDYFQLLGLESDLQNWLQKNPDIYEVIKTNQK